MASRWDRERFERERYGGERDLYRADERDRFPPRSREILLDERRGPGRYEERERLFEEERYAPPARSTASFLNDPVPAELNRQALAPYRRPRPQYIRRQSSLDTFDRKPLPRPGDEYRLPPDVPIPLPIRRPRSPPRGRYYEEVEEKYRDSDEEYRDVRINRGGARSRSRMRSRSVRRRRSRSSSSSASSVTDTSVTLIGRRGRTKLPKRLAHKNAINELGLPYTEEDHFYIVQRALDKEHIDSIVEISKKYREDKTVTYKYDGVRDEEIIEKDRKEVRKEEKIKETSTGEIVEEKKVVKETKTEEVFEDGGSRPHIVTLAPGGEVVKKKIITTTTIDPPDHHHHHQDLAVVVPRRHTQSEADIRREIRALEAEAEALRLERKEQRLIISDRHDEIVESDRHRKRDIYRVDRDRKGRMALIRSAH